MDEHKVLLEDVDINIDVDDVWANFKPIQVDPVQTQEYLDLSTIKQCPRCLKPLVKTIAIAGNESETWLECPECGTLVNTFRPTHYQAIFLIHIHDFEILQPSYYL